ncbi:alpha/beta hydrolase [Litoreibacter arenae]|uniref:Hydrolase of the alpha/beta superfamily n=1 Tax=Litoreibacter arenae DSM 19593 TaxID=1123360 RepID=S9QJS1_9RHOB|nr:alpha/beta fold hydrolase [Litoreibacter arenae]EPX79843.1 Hydrolase of the alpha/beta superfamily [Litoreibacter arenae DSM 19593]
MRLLLRLAVLLALFFGAYFTLERLLVYPLDPRAITPSDSRIAVTKVGSMIVWTAAPQRGKPTILYIHGNAGHVAKRTARFQRLMDRGYGLVAPSLRGGNGSKGWPTEAGITADMTALYTAITNGQLTGTPTTPILYGESIGAAVAIQLATTNSPKAVILESPFTSLKDVAAHLHPQLPLATGLMLSRWPSIDRAPKVKAPLLILHGTRDNLIPPSMGRAILAAAGSSQKELYPVQGAGHINIWTGDAQRRMYKFLRQF